MTLDEPWLAATWLFVQRHLPPPPATVLEIGCGSKGGFVPELRRCGYDALGVDPNAPDEPAYRRTKFEDAPVSGSVRAVVACTALHHVGDLDDIVGRMAATLDPAGTLVVIEWAWERFDRATAQWCFSRLDPAPEAHHGSWLRRHEEQWREAGGTWEAYLRSWATAEGLHPAARIIDALDERFRRIEFDEGPYFYSDLSGTSELDEQAAIDRGDIRATCLRYVATRR